MNQVQSVWKVGGIITPGGTASNTVAMMLARERWAPVEVPTRSFRYDPSALADALGEHGDDVAAVVAYAGDSRTQTVEHPDLVGGLVRARTPRAWLHADD